MFARLIYFSLLVVCVFLSGTAKGQDDLERYLPDDQVTWLTGDDDERYLALYLEPLKAFSRGSVLTLPDWHLHPLQSPLLAYNHTKMAELGWHSWALTPPDQPLKRYQLQNLDSLPEQAFESQVTALNQRLQSWQQAQQEYLGFSVMIAEGVTAALLVKALLAQPQQMPDVLVVLDLYLPNQQANRAVSRQLAQLQLPVLDIYSEAGNPWTRSAQQWRSQLSQKYQHISYRQKQLLGSAEVAQRQLATTIKGWLQHHGY